MRIFSLSHHIYVTIEARKVRLQSFSLLWLLLYRLGVTPTAGVEWLRAQIRYMASTFANSEQGDQ